MREIKFKAYYRGHMYDHINLRIEPDYTAVEIVKGRGNNVYTDTTKAKLLQYIGLKDKNGVEIYEGDIVKVGRYYEGKSKFRNFILGYADFSDKIKVSSEILISRGCCDNYGYEEVKFYFSGFYLKEIKSDYSEIIEYYTERSVVDELSKHGLIEVIGNIYENPDLLK